jgi:hypothetical protein
MKSEIKLKPAALSLLLLLVAALLTGFSSPSADLDFIAPIKKPSLAIYHNFSLTGIYTDPFSESSAVEQLNKYIGEFANTNTGMNLAGNKMLKESLQPQQLFFYFTNADEFCLILTGRFRPESFVADRAENSKEANNTCFEHFWLINTNKASNYKLGMREDLLMIAPAAKFADFSQALMANESLLGSHFMSFKKMYNGKPAVAAEIDMQALDRVLASSSIRVPREIKALQHLRVIADDQMIKAQLYVPDDDLRALLEKRLEQNLAWFNNLGNNIASFTLHNKNHSIFLQTEATKELEQQLGQKFAAFVLHFFARRLNSEIPQNINTRLPENDQTP